MDYIQGEERDQVIMFPDCMDDYVDKENAVRVIDAYVNHLELRELGFTKTEPNETGRPMYAPQDMLKMYIYGYMNRTRSSRRLEAESKRNLEMIWLMRKLSPDHKTIARFRHDNADALKKVFKDFVRLCIRQGLYGKELIAIDGSKFKAVNSKDRNFTDKKLEERIARLEIKIEEYLRQMDAEDLWENTVVGEKKREEITQIVSALAQRKELYQSYLEELRDSGEGQKSLTDPDSRLMLANGKQDVCYNVQTAVDGKNKMIVDFEVTNSGSDINQLNQMASEAAETLGKEQLTVTADAGYDNATEIAECLMQGITPHVAGTDFDICLPTDESNPATVTSQENGRCVYMRERNIVICPMGQVLYPSFYKSGQHHAVFCNRQACKNCKCKCTVERERRFEIAMDAKDFKRTYDDEALRLKQVRIKADKAVVRRRKTIVEHPYGSVKRAMDAGYCLTKGMQGVRGEFSLLFLAFNLKRAIKILGARDLLQAIQP